MEKDFFILYSGKRQLSLNVGHNGVADWIIEVFDRRVSEINPVVHTHSCIREEAFAEAYTKLANYFSSTFGGY